jgi:hypothetical protein
MEASDQVYVPATLFLGKVPPICIERKAAWVLESEWMLGRRENYIATAENRNIPRWVECTLDDA